MENKKIIIVWFLLIVIFYSWLNFMFERKNIIFQKCLDVIPEENMLNIETFNLNVNTCRK